MNYEEFKAEMRGLLRKVARYTPEQAGFSHYVSLMADLADAYPEFDEALENEPLSGEE